MFLTIRFQSNITASSIGVFPPQSDREKSNFLLSNCPSKTQQKTHTAKKKKNGPLERQKKDSLFLFGSIFSLQVISKRWANHFLLVCVGGRRGGKVDRGQGQPCWYSFVLFRKSGDLHEPHGLTSVATETGGILGGCIIPKPGSTPSWFVGLGWMGWMVGGRKEEECAPLLPCKGRGERSLRCQKRTWPWIP